MHPIVLIVLGALGGWAAYRWLNSPSGASGKTESQKESEQRSELDKQHRAEDLVQDPETGVFKSKDD